MILIGTMNLTRTRDRGDFYCPGCCATKGYRVISRRPFLTLYFIPTVPVGAAEMYVECDGCRENWDVSVLEQDRTLHEEQVEGIFRDEAIRASVLVVLADDVTTPREITVLQRIATHLLERRVDRDELGRLCSIARENRITATNYVLTVSRKWNRDQRSRALQAMFLAATAEGGLGQEQLRVLAEMREILDLTEEEYQSAIETALDWESV